MLRMTMADRTRTLIRRLTMADRTLRMLRLTMAVGALMMEDLTAAMMAVLPDRVQDQIVELQEIRLVRFGGRLEDTEDDYRFVVEVCGACLKVADGLKDRVDA